MAMACLTVTRASQEGEVYCLLTLLWMQKKNTIAATENKIMSGQFLFSIGSTAQLRRKTY